jgi:hypothetical protein
MKELRGIAHLLDPAKTFETSKILVGGASKKISCLRHVVTHVGQEIIQ